MEKKETKKFPFWARLKFEKKRPTLVIDEAPAWNRKKHREEDGYVHRESSHTEGHGEKIEPNPDRSDPRPMFLKKPRRTPKRLFNLDEVGFDMPKELEERYSKNNKKDK